MKAARTIETMADVTATFAALPRDAQRVTLDMLEHDWKAAGTAPARRALRKKRNGKKRGANPKDATAPKD